MGRRGLEDLGVGKEWGLRVVRGRFLGRGLREGFEGDVERDFESVSRVVS